MQKCLNELRTMTLPELKVLSRICKNWGFAWDNLLNQVIEEKEVNQR